VATEQRPSTGQGATFDRFLEQMRGVWAAGRDESLPHRAKPVLEALLREAPADEPWAAGIRRDAPIIRELYRDPEHGFLQLGHLMSPGPGPGTTPHDHGPCFVLYGVFEGEIELTTFRRTDDGSRPDRATLEEIETIRLKPGQVRAYLPGEIHLQRPTDPAGSVVLRFTSADLDRVERHGFDQQTGEISRLPPIGN
jgi:predicted metal-dependent enzyme (double-stranded beta helix superfamily)